MKSLFIKNHSTFHNIKKQKKKIEGRLNYGFNKKLRTGELIIIKHKHQSIIGLIIDIKKYPNFTSLVSNENIRYISPDTTSIDSIKQTYNAIYTDKKQKKYGVLAIYLGIIYDSC